MKDLGITKGEWVVGFSKESSDDYYIQPTPTFGEQKNNSNLIEDAANTAQKCGLLPSELLQQRDELLEVLESMTKINPDFSGIIHSEQVKVDLEDLKKCGWEYAQKWLEELRLEKHKWANSYHNLRESAGMAIKNVKETL